MRLSEAFVEEKVTSHLFCTACPHQIFQKALDSVLKSAPETSEVQVDVSISSGLVKSLETNFQSETDLLSGAQFTFDGLLKSCVSEHLRLKYLLENYQSSKEERKAGVSFIVSVLFFWKLLVCEVDMKLTGAELISQQLEETVRVASAAAQTLQDKIGIFCSDSLTSFCFVLRFEVLYFSKS